MTMTESQYRRDSPVLAGTLITPEQADAARRVVAAHAVDEDDEQHLLGALGLANAGTGER
jgi:hypothetical protein